MNRRGPVTWKFLLSSLAASLAFVLPLDGIAAGDPPIKDGMRLSDWLLARSVDPNAYPFGLSWNVPAARDAQAAVKYRLLARLNTEPLGESAEVRATLSTWLNQIPVTGRVPVPIADARWLQAHPERDPVLDGAQTLVMPRRPHTITIITSEARFCVIPHVSGSEVGAYLSSAFGAGAHEVDSAWLVQPDGRVDLTNVAQWNISAQDEPAPGAWIWAPQRGDNWPTDFSEKFADFLATQGVSSDAGIAARDSLPIAGNCKKPAPVVPVQKARNPQMSANDWGFIGLLQTPTARMGEAGEFRFTYSQVWPYDRGSLVLQPFDWLTGGFRYTNLSNLPYGEESLSGNQSLKDKSFDLKLRLMTETATRPQLAVGIIDLAGTGLFSSEYLVANKRVGDFDFSAGLAWGYLGSSYDLKKNPLSIFGKSFNKRDPNDNPTGGTVGYKNFFHGPTALFGGVQYHSPIDKLLLKIEYDGNNYKHEPYSDGLSADGVLYLNKQKQSSPVNVGAVYQLTPGIDLSAGVERGNTFMFSLTFHDVLSKANQTKYLDAQPPRVTSMRPKNDPDWNKTAAEISLLTQWSIRTIQRKGSELNVVLEDIVGFYVIERMDKALAVLQRDAPEGVSRFVFTFTKDGIAFSEWVVLREEWVAKQIRYRARAEQFAAMVATEPQAKTDFAPLWSAPPDKLTFGYGPTFARILGGPDAFLLYEIGVTGWTKYRFTDATWMDAQLHLRLIDNYNKFKYTAPSNLPRVRTYQREFVTSSRVTIPDFQITHLKKLSDDQYMTFYAGILEQEFSGVGSEWMYRPWNSNLAFGIDVNRVQQRDFDQNFKSRGYSVNTGHATLYWDTGWEGVFANISAGQYLAGDRGVTVNLSRRFRNGVSMGAYATKTNVSAAEFGEGSFDKGLYFSIPFDAMLPLSTVLNFDFAWSPLTRDGGAKLWRTNTLYGITSEADKSFGRYASAGSEAWYSLESDEARRPTTPLWPAIVDSGRWLKLNLTSGRNTDAIIVGSALVLASSALDRPAAKWADKHQGGNWDSAGKATNYIPVALAATSTALRFGAGGDVAADTARASLLAAGWTLGLNTASRFVVGRSRPDENMGPDSFKGPSKNSISSSFPSNHMGLAFATVTPYAQRFDAPWLYLLAGATAFGRIQQRQHFVSDVVAGSLIGYGMGSLMLDRQRNDRDAKVSIGLNRSVNVSWRY